MSRNFIFVLLCVTYSICASVKLGMAENSLPKSVGDSFVTIPAGFYIKGDPFNEGESNERPSFSCYVSEFQIDRFEMTVSKWQEIYSWAITNGYQFDNTGSGASVIHPITEISFLDVLKWLNARSQKEGLIPVYYTDSTLTTVFKTGQHDMVSEWVKWDATGYRLPTEAEWEKAARGGLQGQHFPWPSSNLSWSADIFGYNANYQYSGDPYDNNPTPVGYYNGQQQPSGPDMANGYGLYDVAGNVWEYVWDRWSDYGDHTTNTLYDPKGPLPGVTEYRTRRSGGCENSKFAMRCSYEYFVYPTDIGSSIGFRCAKKFSEAPTNSTPPKVLPPSRISPKSFTARWDWGVGGSPEGEISVALDKAFTTYVNGFNGRYVVNAPSVVVPNILAGLDYWYKVRRIMPDGTFSPWTSSMKVRTGTGIPVFKHLLSNVPTSKGIVQEFAIPSLVSGVGTLAVKSSNTNAVKVTVSPTTLTLQYLWKATNTATVTMTLTHPATGYKASYGATVSQAVGPVAVFSQSALTNAGTVVAQEITLENQTDSTVYGVRVRAKGLDNTSWLINQTGLDPVNKAAIREVPCVLPAGSQTVVRLVYNLAYKKQAKVRPVVYGAWAIMTPVNGAGAADAELTITQHWLDDGLWSLGMPANRNRLYTVYHSDDDGATWTLNVPQIRATSNYLMWLDTDEGAPAGRVYKVVDSGM